MFAKRYRLQAHWLFTKTLKQGMRYYVCPLFTILALKHWHPNARATAHAQAHYRPRIGFVISKKVDKRAVKRNRLKRISREWIRQHVWPRDTLDMHDIAALAVVFRPEAGKASEVEIMDRLQHAFSPKQLARLAPRREA
jgi:ribonuclease P protein component